ncbi:MAG: TetR/AcrR family transcriptional regulator [Acidobacteriota bacterium]
MPPAIPGGDVAVAAKRRIRAPLPGRRQRRAAETRMRLFRSALQLFAKRGFSSVTVEDITEAADVGKGTFFNYFATKDHVLGVMTEIQLGKVRQAAALAGAGKQSIQSVLRRLLLNLAEEPGRSPALARALISSFLASAEVRRIIEANMREVRGIVAGIIAAGQERGEVSLRAKKEKAASQFLQAFLGALLLWSLHGKPALASWLDDTFEHFWGAISIPG